MPSQIFAILLIILSALPFFPQKEDWQASLKNQLIGVNQARPPKTDITPVVIPYKVDPLADAAASAKAAYFVDFDSGEVLYAKNENLRLPMASTTKLMTAIIVIENLKLDQTVTVPKLNTLPLDSVMGLTTGDRLKVSELLHGLLIESGGDAAETLAVATSGTENKFVALMNEQASQFGLTDTQFIDPVGHDYTGQYSTAKDLYKLARLALTNENISAIVSTKSYVATAASGKKYSLANTNQLLADSRYQGIKTGTTYAAGECLISLYSDGDRRIIGVVLDSPSRFTETSRIIEWTKRVFKW